MRILADVWSMLSLSMDCRDANLLERVLRTQTLSAFAWDELLLLDFDGVEISSDGVSREFNPTHAPERTASSFTRKSNQ